MKIHPDIHGDVCHISAAAELALAPSRGELLERYFAQVFKPSVWALTLAGAFLVGLSVRHTLPEPILSSGDDYHRKAARLVAGEIAVEHDRREHCLVLLHKDAAGMASVSWHCPE